MVKKIFFLILLTLFILGCTNDSDSSNTNINTYTLTSSSIDSTQGTVIKSSSKLQYDINEEITLTAIPLTGYKFKDWIGDSQYQYNTSNPLTVTMDHNISLYAEFEKDISDSLFELKSEIAEYLIEDEIDYSEAEEIYDQYKDLIGIYSNDFLLKYLELKELYIDSGNLELIEYANSDDFDKNLFFMNLKYAIDKAKFYDKSSVVLSGFDTLEVSLYSDVSIHQTASYYSDENYTELKTLYLKDILVKAKTYKTGNYGERKDVSFIAISAEDTHVTWWDYYNLIDYSFYGPESD